MLSLFNDDLFHRPRIYNFPAEDMLQRRYKEDYGKLHDYLLGRKFFLPNDHILVKLIKTINVSFKRDLYDYVNNVSDIVPDYETMLKLTSSLRFSLPDSKSYFYNQSVTEVLISIREDFNIKEAMQNWQLLEPIKVISHPFTDLSYTPLTGKYVSSNEKGLAYIFIDIPKLMFQYRMWIRAYLKAGKKIDEPAKFLIDYPLFNMMKSHTDITMFNRCYNKLHGIDYMPFNPKISLAVVNNSKYADQAIDSFINQITKSSIRFDEILFNMPLVFNENFMDVIKLPDIAKTRQVKPALLGCRIKLFEFLLKVNEIQNSSINRNWLNPINNDLKYLDTENILKYGLLSETDERVRSIRRMLTECGY